MSGPERLYRAVLRAYPRHFRRVVGPELLAAFSCGLGEAEHRRRFAARELADLLLSLPAEWWVSLLGRTDADGRERSGVSYPFRHLFPDIRFTLRGLRKRPGFAATTVAVLGVGIGATTAIFTVFNAVLLRPLPYPDPHRLVTVWQTREAWAESPNPLLRSFAFEFPLAWDTYQDWSAFNSCFHALGVHTTPRTYVLAGGDSPDLVVGAEASSGLFATLGVPPILGRTLVPADDEVGAARVAVLSHGLWKSRFGADSTVVGRTVILNGISHTVVGVMPPSFYFPSQSTGLWRSLADDRKNPENGQTLWVTARLKPNTSVERAQAEMEAIQRRITERVPAHSRFGVRVVDRREAVVGEARPVLGLLVAAVATVLLITCANIANLLLMRASERRHELSVRSALGAGQGRLLTQLLTESIILAVLGGGLGLALSVACLKPLVAFLPPELPRTGEIRLDGAVLFISTVVSLGTGVLMGVLPAARAARVPASGALSDSGIRTTGGRARSRMQRGIVVTEVAFSFVLLVGAGLLTKSMARMSAVDLGFDVENVVALEFRFSSEQYRDQENRLQAYDLLQERFRALPGVRAVSSSAWVPFLGSPSGGDLHFLGRSGPETVNVGWNQVGQSYFDVLGVPMVSGRTFGPPDVEGDSRTAIVSETLARVCWPGQDPVGERIGTGPELDLTIIGVAADIRHPGRGSDQTTEPRSLVYLPVRTGRVVSLRVTGQPSAIVSAATAAAREFDPNLLVVPHIIGDRVRASLAGPRSCMWMVGLLALLAGLLASVGIYGVLSFAVEQRSREIGICIALGAPAGKVWASVFERGLLLIGSGIAAGSVVALVAAAVLPNPEDLLYQVRLTDPGIILAAALLSGLTGACATAIPAARAVGVDPVATLRRE